MVSLRGYQECRLRFVRLDSRNQVTLPDMALSAFPDATYFDVTTERGRLVLTPVRSARAATVHDRLAVTWGAPGLSQRRTGGRPMKMTVTIDRDEDGVWIAECPAIPGCVSQGDTKDEALTNIREAIELCLDVRAEAGMPLTLETRQVEVAP